MTIEELASDDVAAVKTCEQAYQRLRTELAKKIVGQHAVIEQVLIAVLARARAAGRRAGIGENVAR